jgi:hypothetical protein
MLGLAVGAVHPRHVTMQLDRTYAEVSHWPSALFDTHSDIGRWSTKLASPNASRHDVGDSLGLALGLTVGDMVGFGLGVVLGSRVGVLVGYFVGDVHPAQVT